MERMGPDENPYFVGKLTTGYAVLADNQHLAGYTIFLSKTCVPELHDLAQQERTLFLNEMALVAEAVFRAFAPRKLNYELLGNSVPHLHWHIFPRHASDPNPTWPVWNNEAFLKAPRVTPIEPQALEERRKRLAEQISLLREKS
jgi:diadenosine tetraphosphate (Ap4A) HIT family hydrolase